MVTCKRFRLHKGAAIAFFVVLLIIDTSSFSQQSIMKVSTVIQSRVDVPPAKYTPLKIGDQVPELPFQLINYSKDFANISDFKGKLVILDFWATWCGSCIAAFPKMDSFQKIFGNQLQIILVNSYNSTKDKEEKVRDFFLKRKNPNGLSYQLAVAVNDSLSEVLFPHSEVPHYAWIGADGKVKAITGSHEVTAENIRTALKNTNLNLELKKDFYSDKLVDYGQGEVLIDDHLNYYSLLRKGKVDGLSTFDLVRLIYLPNSRASEVRGKGARNVPLLDMYQEAVYYDKTIGTVFTPKRIVLDMNDKSKLIFDPSKSTKEAWEKENLYTYDLVMPAVDFDSLHWYIIKDLNQHSGYYGRVEKRKVKCLALVRTSAVDNIKTKGGQTEYNLFNELKNKYIRNLSIDEFISRLDVMEGFKLPIVNDTNYQDKIDMDFPIKNVDNVSDIISTLHHYGLDLVEKEKEIYVFVISEK